MIDLFSQAQLGDGLGEMLTGKIHRCKVTNGCEDFKETAEVVSTSPVACYRSLSTPT